MPKRSPRVLAGQAQLGQLSSTAQFFTAFEAGRPLKLFASGFRYSPYAYISLPKTPVRTPADLVGKTVAINPNGRYLLDLIMAKNGLDRSSVKVVTIGADMTPLIAGQVDAVSDFLTNTKALSILGPDVVTLIPANTGVPTMRTPTSQRQMPMKVRRKTWRGSFVLLPRDGDGHSKIDAQRSIS